MWEPKMPDLPESESLKQVETWFDLKWICVVCLITIFIWWFGYLTAGISYPQFYRVLTAGFSIIFLFFDISALTAATLYASGLRNTITRYAAVIPFVLSMVFLFLVYATILLRLVGLI